MTGWVQTLPSVIVQSAVKVDKYIIPGVHHYDHLMIDIFHILDEQENYLPDKKQELGFLDQFGNFFNEEQATNIAIQANQCTPLIACDSKLSHVLWDQLGPRKVVCAALRFDSYVFTAPRHYHPVHHNWFQTLPQDGYWGKYPKSKVEQGFVDQHGVYMDRFEALAVARRANQVKKKHNPIDRLFSEDMY